MEIKKTYKDNVKLVLSLGEATSLYHLLEHSRVEEWAEILNRVDNIDNATEEGDVLEIYVTLSDFMEKYENISNP